MNKHRKGILLGILVGIFWGLDGVLMGMVGRVPLLASPDYAAAAGISDIAFRLSLKTLLNNH